MLMIAAWMFVIWVILMTIFLVPKSVYVNTWDRVTRGKYRGDKDNLQMMLDHLRSFPEQWSLGRDAVAFPLEGKAKQIYLNFNKKTQVWDYSLASFGSDTRPLNGHFGKQFSVAIEEQNNQREKKKLLRELYPDVNSGVLQLT